MTPTTAPKPRGPALLRRAYAIQHALYEGHEAISVWATSHSVTLLTASTGLLLFFVYSWGLRVGGPVTGLIGILCLSVFIATLLVLEIGIGIIVLSMLFSPELNLGSLGLHGITLRLEDVMIPIVLIAWIGRKALGFEQRELRHDLLLGLMATFVMLQVFSSVIGASTNNIDSKNAVLHILKGVQYYVICYFAFQYVDAERRIKVLLGLAILTAAFTSIYNVTKISGNEVWTRNRISAPFEGSPEPSSIGGYFVLVLGIVLALSFEAPTLKIRQMLLGVFGLVFIPFLYTLSRTSYVAFLAMIIVLAILLRSRVLLAMLVFGLFLSPLLMPQSVIDRVMFTFQDHIKVFGLFDRSFGERIYIWWKVWWSMMNDPFFGRGVTYQNVIDSYYARVLIETGLCGLIAFLAIIARLFTLAARVRRHTLWWARGFAIGYTAALVALLLHSFSAITFVIVRIMEPFWLVTGLLMGLAYQMPSVSSEDEAAASIETEATPPPRILREPVRQPAAYRRPAIATHTTPRTGGRPAATVRS